MSIKSGSVSPINTVRISSFLLVVCHKRRDQDYTKAALKIKGKITISCIKMIFISELVSIEALPFELILV